MRTSVKVGVGFALIWVVYSIIILSLGYSIPLFNVGILVVVFLLLAAIAVGVFLEKKKQGYEQRPFLDDLKVAMQSGIIFAVLVSGYTYIYHTSIDTSIREKLHADRVEALMENFPDEEKYKELQKKDPTWRNKSYDDYMENQLDSSKDFLGSAGFVAIMHLAVLFFFTFFYGFFAVVVLRKVVLRH